MKKHNQWATCVLAVALIGILVIVGLALLGPAFGNVFLDIDDFDATARIHQRTVDARMLIEATTRSARKATYEAGLPPSEKTVRAARTINFALTPTMTPLPPLTPTQASNFLDANRVLFLAGQTGAVDLAQFACDDKTLAEKFYPIGYRVVQGAKFYFFVHGTVKYSAAANQPVRPDGADFDTMILPFQGISGYLGPAGAFAGVFLDDAVPHGPAPPMLDFRAAGLGVEFSTLEPGLGQVFFIGDGLNPSAQQVFIAPSGATRLYLGLVDGRGFTGQASCYDDNHGTYYFSLSSNRPFVALDAEANPVPYPLSTATLAPPTMAPYP